MKKPQDKYKISYMVVIALLLLNLFFIYLLKYINQGLPVTEFSFFKAGNIINFLFIFILILGLTILLFRNEIKLHTRTIISLVIILNILLVFSAILNFITLPLPDYYIFDYHISRVIVGIMFALYQFMLLVFISAVWLFVLGYDRFLYLRAIINSVFLMTIIFIVAVVYLVVNNRDSVVKERQNNNNVAVVLGAAVWSNKPSPSLSSRADKAAGLLRDGKVRTIHLTGSNAPGELSEAEMAYNYLSAKDLNMNNVFIETETTSTNEQIRYIKSNLYNKPDVDEIIIISDGYHLARIKEICRFQHMNVKVVASDLAHNLRDKLYYNFREAVGIIIFWLFAL
jgi:vancomycin permeability regulator SanA